MLRMKLYPILLSILLAANAALAGDAAQSLPNLPGEPGGANIDMATLRRQVDDANKKAEGMASQQTGLPGQGDADQSKLEGTEGQEATPKQSGQLAVGEQAAREAMERYSAEMKPKVAEEISRQEETSCGCTASSPIPGAESETASSDTDTDTDNTKVVRGLQEKFFDSDEKVYLFISSSMPDSTVRAYLERIAVAGKDEQVSTVMFGIIGGMEEGKKAMSEYLARVLLVNPECKDRVEAICERYPVNLEFNSIIFKKFKITKVPSVVYVRGDKYWTVDGDSSLEYLLKKINSELKQSSIDNLITSINERS